jgi:ferredoxin-NADP reductase
LIAGGIGITPIKTMAQALKARGTSFELHYSGRTTAEMAYRNQLAIEFSDQLHQYFTRTTGGNRLDIKATLAAATPDTLFYVCGPARLIEAVTKAARELGIPGERLQYESFE